MEKILSDNHWKVASYRQRITRDELRKLLLESQDTIIRFGSVCDMQKKHLGAGVYEVWFEKRPFHDGEWGH